MYPAPTAYVVSDFPIIAAATERALSGRYLVQRVGWSRNVIRPMDGAALVVLDVTEVEADVVMSLLSTLPVEVRIVVSSLNRNEVDVYRIHHGGLVREAALPSLLALPA